MVPTPVEQTPTRLDLFSFYVSVSHVDVTWREERFILPLHPSMVVQQGQLRSGWAEEA